MQEKFRIGISSCLLGHEVRWNAGHKLDKYLTYTLGQFVAYVAVCPEVEAGFGIPRESMRLVGDPDHPRLITFKSKTDHTDRMVAWAKKRVRELEKEDLCGFIFKSDSPSTRAISATSSRKLTFGVQPSFCFALVASPSKVSTSDGR